MIESIKRIRIYTSQTLPWVNLAAFITLVSVALVGAMIVVGIVIIKPN